MKKILFLALAAYPFISSQGQLKVNANGTTETKTISAVLDSATQYTAEYGILSHLNKPAQSQHITTAIKGYNTGKNGNHNDLIGIHAVAEYGENNFGVIANTPYTWPGVLGAALYASVNYGMIYPDDLYAGYFDGDVKVIGNIRATGLITDCILGFSLPNGSSSRQLRTSDVTFKNISNSLSSLQVGTYYSQNVAEKKPVYSVRTLKELTSEEEENIRRIEQQKVKANDSRLHYALDADQLEEAFPDLVYENEDGSKSINYVEMVPILVQAINELTAKVAVLEGNEMTSKRAIPSTTGISTTDESVTLLSLGQNKPNPFGETTSIAVSVPEDVQTAFLYVYNLNGSKVAQVDIPARGTTSVTLSAATLSEGMYLYSLVADGKIVQTRRMIVEK